MESLLISLPFPSLYSPFEAFPFLTFKLPNTELIKEQKNKDMSNQPSPTPFICMILMKEKNNLDMSTENYDTPSIALNKGLEIETLFEFKPHYTASKFMMIIDKNGREK
ncbi:unnamed protein product [Cuscuta europaea]|uniref:Uncharacterized protein n=1 Tax=Cuscuta europaea TaxID=41803 RepID=A0A9P0ZJ02_CUSEU|nr:unnamed protein product [Cuscuta europaea]